MGVGLGSRLGGPFCTSFVACVAKINPLTTTTSLCSKLSINMLENWGFTSCRNSPVQAIFMLANKWIFHCAGGAAKPDVLLTILWALSQVMTASWSFFPQKRAKISERTKKSCPGLCTTLYVTMNHGPTNRGVLISAHKQFDTFKLQGLHSNEL